MSHTERVGDFRFVRVDYRFDRRCRHVRHFFNRGSRSHVYRSDRVLRKGGVISNKSCTIMCSDWGMFSNVNSSIYGSRVGRIVKIMGGSTSRGKNIIG